MPNKPVETNCDKRRREQARRPARSLRPYLMNRRECRSG